MTSFTHRLTLRIALLVTATAAAVLAAGYLLLQHQTERGLELLNEVEAREIAEMVGEEPGLDAAAVRRRIQEDADRDDLLFVIQVAAAGGEVFFRSENLGDTLLPSRPANEPHRTIVLPGLGSVHVSAFEMGPWRIQVGSLLEPTERILRDYVRVSVALLLAVTLLSVALGYAFSRATLRPIRAIAETANRISADNLSERIPVPSGRDELASLTRLLNQTFDRLQASFEQVRRFTGDVSHELKTPLALIRLNTEKLRSRLAADSEGGTALADILEELARLNQVVDRLLFLAKSESGALSLALRPVAMHELLASFAEDAQALAEDRGARFELVRNEAGEISGDADLLRQLLLNLVANAVSVSPHDGVVTIESGPVAGGWRLVVADEGPGLPEPQLARVFERFVQFEPDARGATPRRAGHGLGLAICRSIVALHKGTVRAENRAEPRGLRIVVELPRRDGSDPSVA